MASKRDALVASAEKSLAKGKVDSALKDYQKVLEEIPGDINILNKVGDLLTRLNRNEEAIPYFTKIAEHFARDGFFEDPHERAVAVAVALPHLVRHFGIEQAVDVEREAVQLVGDGLQAA